VSVYGVDALCPALSLQRGARIITLMTRMKNRNNDAVLQENHEDALRLWQAVTHLFL